MEVDSADVPRINLGDKMTLAACVVRVGGVMNGGAHRFSSGSRQLQRRSQVFGRDAGLAAPPRRVPAVRVDPET
jgi:hypothetical protein